MKTRSTILLAAAALLLFGCQLTAVAPTPTPLPPSTPVPVGNPGEVSLDYSAIASNISLETVPATTATPGGPYWEGTPEYFRYTLQGYPVSNHNRAPQLFIFKVADLAPANEAMAGYAADLQTLLQNHQAGNQIPFLPISSESQMFRARMEFVDFKSGQGVIFLTRLGQGIVPINNSDLILAFQGLTYDGKYYLSAILPVTLPDLPADAASGQLPDFNELPAYLNDTIKMLEDQPAGSFTPSLETLNALIRSIEVK
jgi:hypothetical protein